MKNTGAAAGSKWLLGGLGILIALIGLGLAAGGGYLLSLGGSAYFLLMGLAMLVSGLLIARRNPRGAWLYGVALVLTAIWAVWDAGLEYWPLVSRVLTFAVIGLVVALIYPTLVRASGAHAGRGAYGLAGLLGFGVVATLAYMFVPTHVVKADKVPAVQPVAPGTEQKDWAHWGNTTAGNRFAALDQINKGNIDQLQVAWTFRTGDLPESNGAGAEDQNTPLQIGDTVYTCTAYGKVFALDADTGAERWKFDPQGYAPNWQRCRGLGYFDASATPVADASAPAAPAACTKRLFLPTGDARLIAINAETGKPCEDFGNQGTVDLKTDMGEIKPGYYQQTSTPLVAGTVVIVGGRVADNFSTGEPPGVVRAFDVRSGELMWAWDPGNPATTKRPPAGETYTRGTPNVWSAMSYDAKLGLVYLPTGNATPDFFGGQRTEFDDKWNSSIVAIDVKTGQVRWHFQTTHHDLWDFDLPAQPLLYDIPDDKGGVQPALAQVTKQGEIFLLNRETGKPIARVEERPVPQGNVPGERYSPTQPFSVEMPSIGNQTLTESDMWGATPFDQLMCRIQFKGMRHEGVYTPPGLDHALQFPGSLGGMNWGSVSVDPTSNYMFVNDMRLGLANYMIPRDQIAAGASGIEMGVVPQEGTPFGAMRQRFLSAAGIPCQKPPFGTMSAIDLKTRKLVWQVPVGTVQDTGPLGIRMHLPIPIGMPTLGASLATQSGLLFFAGTQDFYLRAFDTGNGNEIWKARLPVGSQSGPMTYVSPKTGRQYILLTAGGARQSTDRGDYVIAYALPKK
ncbi:glucose/quinate/shikimate family membrane-bound PQQ-dependent dehydrogenase [Pseudomonas protegens]|uniref:Quinate/shikimate dehydrogenase n=1 Tax=Pseudomonas protegens (strain DSM 19095 / LMG 27888 / CFBP 6595 / CHA0) TaxID=1124983 RepID=A0A2C9EV40_PSEPH|nr:glucose/quinate/shikimate family membrane-bound PQQ-dependent dehydrogenase [Pseudomonas protegens]AGL87348.1 quinate/shikimate dehydrogenase [Pseudomonas protegens CHA0]MBP5110368.1 glucose/quinate/shikimate family membrane-bound PQQ-dependent dehydrogenase [Pseudomonas protegens]NMZ28634.1 glucose/quinate/shikimate family membrane-bound PQQ-dependent dehydrogenase [Pseudomonas protegens]NMZ87353.1 glucose/quinate/shikimate family membrane-bound PQQ-dependent dehydrogenase [Pseudomonas prot